MAKLLKLRRGTTSQHGSFTGAEGEVTVDTDKETLVVHDGSTAGGHAVAAEDMANVSSASIVGRLGSGSIVKAKLEADIIDGTKLADDAVNSEHYVDASIDHQHLSNDCIDGDNIQDDVINSEHIAAGAVDLEHMSSESVDEDNLKISNSGSNGQYLSKQSSNAGGLTWATVDFSPYAPLASPALTGTATGVNLTLSGNLTVNGTTTTVATTNTTVTDNLLELNSGAGSNGNDCGILIERGSTGNNAIFAWDEANDRFSLGTTTATNTATGSISINTGSLAANLVGNVTGNVTGNLTGTASSATNADTVDTLHATSFVRSDASDTLTGQQYTISSATNEKLILSGSASPYIRFQEGTTNRAYLEYNTGNIFLWNQNSNTGLRVGAGIDFYHGGAYRDLVHQNNVGSGGALSSSSVYLQDLYCSNWLRQSQNLYGLYNSANNNYFYSNSGAYWELAYNGSAGGLRIADGHNGAVRGYLYADDSNNVGLLDNAGSWIIKGDSSSNTTVYGNVTPSANNSFNSGSSSNKWAAVYATTVHDSKGTLRQIPNNHTTSAYTLVAADSGKVVTNTSGGVNVPYNVFAVGDTITIINQSGSDITITQGSSNTMYNTADASTGNRTLAGRGMATVWYKAQNECYISGAGLS
tara:strand:+ start:1155 stop:3080 length:1926 start_codon:yes stop_codon:yes gene_type:complete